MGFWKRLGRKLTSGQILVNDLDRMIHDRKDAEVTAEYVEVLQRARDEILAIDIARHGPIE